jgi:hypothetical protein
MQPIITETNNQESVILNDFHRTGDNIYFITDTSGTINGWLTLLCTNCFAKSCEHTAHKYPGMLCRNQIDEQGNKKFFEAYVASPHINTLVSAYIGITATAHIINPKPIAAIPNFCLPKNHSCNEYGKKNEVSYDGITKPYFSNTEDVCVLDGIPSIKNNDFYPVFSLDTVHECSLSDIGECTRRQAYFKFRDKEYPFGMLVMFPKFYKTYIDTIQNHQCNATRDTTKTVFEDCFGTLEKEKVWDNMFAMLYRDRNWIKNDNTITSRDEDYIVGKYINIAEENNNFIIQNPIDFVRFSLCAKIADNTALAISFLQIYDHIATERKPTIIRNKGCREHTEHYYSLYCSPFSGIDAVNCWLDDVPADARRIPTVEYDAFLQNLHTFSTIKQQIATIKQQRRLINISPRMSIEIQKEHDSTYIIYPWEKRNCIQNYDLSVDWFRGKRFLLTHSPYAEPAGQ